MSLFPLFELLLPLPQQYHLLAIHLLLSLHILEQPLLPIRTHHPWLHQYLLEELGACSNKLELIIRGRNDGETLDLDLSNLMEGGEGAFHLYDSTNIDALNHYFSSLLLDINSLLGHGTAIVTTCRFHLILVGLPTHATDDASAAIINCAAPVLFTVIVIFHYDPYYLHILDRVVQIEEQLRPGVCRRGCKARPSTECVINIVRCQLDPDEPSGTGLEAVSWIKDKRRGLPRRHHMASNEYLSTTQAKRWC